MATSLVSLFQNSVKKLALALNQTMQVLVVLIPLSMLVGSAITDILLSAAGVLFVVRSGVVEDWQWLQATWWRWAFVLWGYLLLRSCFADMPMEALSRAIPWVRFPLFAVALQYGVLNVPQARSYLRYAILVALGLGVADTLLQFFYGVDMLGHPRDAQRLTGSLRAPKMGITLHWLGMPLLIAAAHSVVAQKRHWQVVVMYLGVALLVVLTILLTGDRAALLLSIFGVACAVFFYPKLLKYALIGGVLLGAGYSAILHVNPDIKARQQSIVQDMQDFGHSPYGYIWRTGWGMFQAHPIVGVGPKQFRSHCETFEPVNSRSGEKEGCNIHPHNMFLEWLSETGLIGLGLFLGMVAAWCRAIWTARSRWVQDPWVVGAVIVIAIRLLPMIPSASMYVAWAAIPLWLYLGIILNAADT